MARSTGSLRVLAVLGTVLVWFYLLVLYILPLYILPNVWPSVDERLWLGIESWGDSWDLPLLDWLNTVLTGLFVYGAGLLLLIVALVARRWRGLIVAALAVKVLLWLLGMASWPLSVPFVAQSVLRMLAIAALGVGGILLICHLRRSQSG